MVIDFHSFLLERFQSACDAYVADLQAMTQEQLETRVTGAARVALDFTYEVAFINRRFAKRLRGELPEPMPEGWIVAPERFRGKDSAIAEFQAARQELEDAWNTVSGADLGREIALPSGATTFPADLMALATHHCGYHDAQLNFIQSLYGDTAVHWSD